MAHLGGHGNATPAPQRAGRASALAGYLQHARALFAARPDRLEDGPTGLPADVEALRWFHLPARCLDAWHRAA
jgi:hypothetical protein